MNSEATSFFPATLTWSVEPTLAQAKHSAAEAETPIKGDELPSGPRSVVEVLVPTPRVPDETLLYLIQQGDKNALGELFRRYARRVRTVSFRILRNESEADDLLQEVFLYIFRKAGLFDSTKGSARSWIVQVTYHRAIDRRRHLVSRHFYDALALDAPDAAQLGREVAFYERSLEGELGKAAIERIENTLSAVQKETLRLCFFEGCTIEEVAQKMGQSPGNVRHHYYRALEKIRKLLFAQKLSAE